MTPRSLRPSPYPGFLGEPDFVRRIGPFLISQNRYAAGVRLNRHAHRQAFISFVITGAYTEFDGRKASFCPPGTLGFHAPDEEHSDRFDLLESLVLSIEYGSPVQQRAARWSSRFLSDGPATRIASLIARESRLQCPASDLIVECLATELAGESGERGGRRGTPRWLATAVELARDRFAERLSLTEVASSAGVHPVHLARQFRLRMGCTFGEFVRRIRLARALERLRDGSPPIADIAAEAGFADQSHLTRLMTAVIGVSPAAYRKAFQSRS